MLQLNAHVDVILSRIGVNNMKPNLGSGEVKRPYLFMNKPSVKRPTFEKGNNLNIKRQTRIRGAGSQRCLFCSSLMGLDDEVCSACGRTVISKDAVTEHNDVKRRMKYLNIKNGYENII